MITPDQKQRVNAYLESCRNRIFELGQWDCALFCADVIKALNGIDHGEGLRGTYATRDGYLSSLPVPLPDIPAHFGLIETSVPHDGAVFWCPAPDSEGGLGVVWQGMALQPGRRGIRRVNHSSTFKYFELCQ